MATRFRSVIALLAAVMVVATAACMVSSPEGEHFNRGFTYMESGEYENAIQKFARLSSYTRTMPSPTETAVLLTQIYTNANGPSRTTTKPSS